MQCTLVSDQWSLMLILKYSRLFYIYLNPKVLGGTIQGKRNTLFCFSLFSDHLRWRCWGVAVNFGWLQKKWESKVMPYYLSSNFPKGYKIRAFNSIMQRKYQILWWTLTNSFGCASSNSRVVAKVETSQYPILQQRSCCVSVLVFGWK